MDLVDALTSDLTRDLPYGFLVEAMTPFLNATALEELVVAAFHLRNVRGGKGQRQLFRDMMSVFYEYDKTLVISLLALIPEFGYWKDVFYLSATLPHLLTPTMELCRLQLIDDEHRVELGYKPSMMAKYIPKQKKKYKIFANSFAKQLYPEIECYSLRMAKTRRRIADLNRLTGAVEVNMCANEWGSIEPRSVAAIAMKNYEQAFLRGGTEDRESCRQAFLQFNNVSKGCKPPIQLTTDSDAYIPVRNAVKNWIAQRA